MVTEVVFVNPPLGTTLLNMEVNVYDSINATPVYGEPHGSTLSPVIIVYSDDQSVRAAVTAALGKQLPGATREHKVVDFATADALRLYLAEKRKVDLFILDGEGRARSHR